MPIEITFRRTLWWTEKNWHWHWKQWNFDIHFLYSLKFWHWHFEILTFDIHPPLWEPLYGWCGCRIFRPPPPTNIPPSPDISLLPISPMDITPPCEGQTQQTPNTIEAFLVWAGLKLSWGRCPSGDLSRGGLFPGGGVDVQGEMSLSQLMYDC